MAPLNQYFSLRKVLVLYLVFSVFTSLLVCAQSLSTTTTTTTTTRRRMLLQDQKEDQPINKKKTITTPLMSTKNQTKLIKTITNSTKNQTNLIKPPTTISDSTIKTKLKKLKNSTSKSSDLNKPIKPITTKLTQKNPDKEQITEKKSKPKQQPNLIDQEDVDDDMVSQFRDLPTKFQQTLLPDLERISKTSNFYITKANKEITNIVGKKYAPTIATIVSFAFIIIPLIIVSLIFNRIKAYFSLQKLLIFIQVYLSIYFFILFLSSLVTGLEPLRFFYSTSQSTYICLQILQTLAYVLYLLLLLMYLVLVFSTDTGLDSKLLGLAQTFVGFAVGLHYYVTVFHRVVLRQPPKTNWKIHGIYATCFLVICLLARAERRKKAYLEDGGEEGKKS